LPANAARAPASDLGGIAGLPVDRLPGIWHHLSNVWYIQHTNYTIRIWSCLWQAAISNETVMHAPGYNALEGALLVAISER
jgi:hypothetical protein